MICPKCHKALKPTSDYRSGSHRDAKCCETDWQWHEQNGGGARGGFRVGIIPCPPDCKQHKAAVAYPVPS